MATTTINFKIKDLDGTAVPYTTFQIESGRLNTGEIPDVVPATSSFTTDANGEASVVLTVTTAPYYLSKLDGTTDKVVSYKFFVPSSDVSLDAELLYVDLGRNSKFYNDKSVAALIEAKITAVNAANRALQVVTTLGSLDTLRTNLGAIISVGTDIAAVNTVSTNIAAVNAVNAATATLTAVNAGLTNIGTVASNIASVNTVAGNSANVTAVAGMSSNIASVVANATDIDTVANNLVDVQAAAAALPGLTNANILAPYVTQMSTVAANINTVNSVGTYITNINDVAGMEADIEALVDNMAVMTAAAAAVTQGVDAQKELFVAGTNYNLGTTTDLALTYIPAKTNAVKVYFDGEYQTKDTYSVVHHTISFNSPITASKVEVQYEVPSAYVALSPADLLVLQTAETNASTSASAASTSAAAALASEVDAQQSASAAALSASSMLQATDAIKELFVAGTDYTQNVSSVLTLADLPAKSNSVLVFFNGVYQNSDTWVRSGQTITFDSPINVARVEVKYEIPSILTGLSTAEDLLVTDAIAAATTINNAITQAVDGIKDLFVASVDYVQNTTTSLTLSNVPAKAGVLKVFFNGVYQNKNTYYLAGSTINFGSPGSPVAIDVGTVEVQYEIPSQFIGLTVGEQAILAAAQVSTTASASAAATSATNAAASEVVTVAAAATVSAAVDGKKDLYRDVGTAAVAGITYAGTYTQGVTTSLTLTAVPSKPEAVKVFLNGVYQNKNSYYLVGSTVNFGVVGTPEPIAVGEVEVQYEIPSTFVGLSVAEQAVLTTVETNVLDAYENFDTRYLGAKAVAPILDNAGNALIVGSMYFNTTNSKMYARTAVNTWVVLSELEPSIDYGLITGVPGATNDYGSI